MSDGHRGELSSLVSPEALKLLEANGNALIQNIGLDVVRGVILDVLTGRNLRDSTEMLTRRRIAALNLAIVDLFLRGSAAKADFVRNLPYYSAKALQTTGLAKSERWFAQWVLGLNDKAVQNVLRDRPKSLDEYRDRYIATCDDAIASHVSASGELRGRLELPSGHKATINWLMMLYLLNTVGAQTLAIRGSEKSVYGKLFERLILGSLLHVLGFKQVVPPPREHDRVFWLSSRGEKRESDATLLYKPGKGARFDIGFIGRGNPEISLDEVSRFERELSLGRSRFYMATVILVDRIGENSRIESLARDIDGVIIQMSASYWPQEVARELRRKMGFQHEILRVKRQKLRKYLEETVLRMPIEQFLPSGRSASAESAVARQKGEDAR